MEEVNDLIKLKKELPDSSDKYRQDILDRREHFLEFMLFLNAAVKTNYASAQLYIQSMDEYYPILMKLWLLKSSIFQDKDFSLCPTVRKMESHLIYLIGKKINPKDFFIHLFCLKVM